MGLILFSERKTRKLTRTSNMKKDGTISTYSVRDVRKNNRFAGDMYHTIGNESAQEKSTGRVRVQSVQG